MKRYLIAQADLTSVSNVKTQISTQRSISHIVTPDKSNESVSPVCFYEASEKPFGVFSNYALSEILAEGQTYASVEHFYQSKKFLDADYANIVRLAGTPNKAKILARQRTAGGYEWCTALNPIIKHHLDRGVTIRDDWEQYKNDVMFTGLHAKFTQHPKLAALLVGTGERQIIEKSPRDSYWGAGKDGTGKNKLGYLLMNIRKALRLKTSRQKRELPEVDEEDPEHTSKRLKSTPTID